MVEPLYVSEGECYANADRVCGVVGQQHRCVRPAEVSDLLEALDGEVLKDATIRAKRGNYRNGDFLVVRLEDT